MVPVKAEQAQRGPGAPALRASRTVLPLASRRPHERATTTIPTRRHGHVVYESSQFRAGIRAPTVGKVEYKRGTDAGTIDQGLYYMAWLMSHKDAFRSLVRDRLGATAATQILWSAPRLICVAGDFTRYDAHAVREHRRSIDLVRYRYFGSDHFGLETVASVTGHSAVAKRVRRRAAGVPPVRQQGGAMAELAAAVDEVLVGLGDGVTRVQRKQYRAYQRLRNFACVIPPQQTKVLVYLKADPTAEDLAPGFTRDVTGLGHHGTGDLEVHAHRAGPGACPGPVPAELRRGVTEQGGGIACRVAVTLWIVAVLPFDGRSGSGGGATSGDPPLHCRRLPARTLDGLLLLSVLCWGWLPVSAPAFP